MNSYICPKCQGDLTCRDNSLVCTAGHTYDIARSGYVNLLLPQQMNAKHPGDNKLMVSARKSFLDKGYYSCLRERFCEAAAKYCQSGLVLDAGCGEGYYTAELAKTLPHSFIMGTDISKITVDQAAKRAKAEGIKNALFSVSSIFHLPVKSGSCSLLTTLFAPYCGEEYSRVLCDGGIMIMVIPAERHLYGLKQAVYDEPYLNEVKDYALDGFTLAERIPVDSEIHLDCGEDIQNLFSMTPYYYKTGEEGQRRLAARNELTTEICFEILVYKKGDTK